MQIRHSRMMTVVMGVALFALGACGSSAIGDNNNDNQNQNNGNQNNGNQNLNPQPVQPEAGVATDIEISIYSDGWGTLLDATTIPTEGPMVIDVDEEDPYSDPPAYYIYARADGFYTELYTCTKGQTINVDLDAVPDQANSVTGVIFKTQGFFADSYYAGETLNVAGPGGITGTLTTDAQGRYGLGDVPLGTYTLSWTYQEEEFSLQVTNTADTDYLDHSFAEPMQMAEPVLYLYPETTTDVQVSLGFPVGGHLTDSDPPYGPDGWQVTVAPNGTIDNQYGSLFYETSVPPRVQTDAGWILDGSNLEGELRTLLRRHGFLGREIDEFVEYWVPRLTGSPWYAVYPQKADALVTLRIDPAPRRLRRLLLLVRGLEAPMSLEAPAAPVPFHRDEGFVALEWGVLVGI